MLPSILNPITTPNVGQSPDDRTNHHSILPANQAFSTQAFSDSKDKSGFEATLAELVRKNTEYAKKILSSTDENIKSVTTVADLKVEPSRQPVLRAIQNPPRSLAIESNVQPLNGVSDSDTSLLNLPALLSIQEISNPPPVETRTIESEWATGQLDSVQELPTSPVSTDSILHQSKLPSNELGGHPDVFLLQQANLPNQNHSPSANTNTDQPIPVVNLPNTSSASSQSDATPIQMENTNQDEISKPTLLPTPTVQGQTFLSSSAMQLPLGSAPANSSGTPNDNPASPLSMESVVRRTDSAINVSQQIDTRPSDPFQIHTQAVPKTTHVRSQVSSTDLDTHSDSTTNRLLTRPVSGPTNSAGVNSNRAFPTNQQGPIPSIAIPSNTNQENSIANSPQQNDDHPVAPEHSARQADAGTDSNRQAINRSAPPSHIAPANKGTSSSPDLAGTTVSTESVQSPSAPLHASVSSSPGLQAGRFHVESRTEDLIPPVVTRENPHTIPSDRLVVPGTSTAQFTEFSGRSDQTVDGVKQSLTAGSQGNLPAPIPQQPQRLARNIQIPVEQTGTRLPDGESRVVSTPNVQASNGHAAEFSNILSAADRTPSAPVQGYSKSLVADAEFDATPIEVFNESKSDGPSTKGLPTGHEVHFSDLPSTARISSEQRIQPGQRSLSELVSDVLATRDALSSENQRITRVRIEIEPPELGEISIQITKSPGRTIATLAVANEYAQNQLQANIQTLQANLESMGVEFEQVQLQGENNRETGNHDDTRQSQSGFGRSDQATVVADSDLPDEIRLGTAHIVDIVI